MPLFQIIGISEYSKQPPRQPQSIPKPRLITLFGTFCEIHRREDLEVDKFTFTPPIFAPLGNIEFIHEMNRDTLPSDPPAFGHSNEASRVKNRIRLVREAR